MIATRCLCTHTHLSSPLSLLLLQRFSFFHTTKYALSKPTHPQNNNKSTNKDDNDNNNKSTNTNKTQVINNNKQNTLTSNVKFLSPKPQKNANQSKSNTEKKEIIIDEKDLEEKFVLGTGPGKFIFINNYFLYSFIFSLYYNYW